MGSKLECKWKCAAGDPPAGASHLLRPQQLAQHAVHDSCGTTAVAQAQVTRAQHPPALRPAARPARCARGAPPWGSRCPRHRCAWCVAAALRIPLPPQLLGSPLRLLRLALSAAEGRPSAHLSRRRRAACSMEGRRAHVSADGSWRQLRSLKCGLKAKRAATPAQLLPTAVAATRLCSSIDRRPWETTTGPWWQFLTQQLSLTWCSSSPTCGRGQPRMGRLANGWTASRAAAAVRRQPASSGNPSSGAPHQIVNVALVLKRAVAAARAVSVARQV